MPAVKLGRFNCGLICGLSLSNVTQKSVREMLGMQSRKSVASTKGHCLEESIGRPACHCCRQCPRAGAFEQITWELVKCVDIDGPLLIEPNNWLNESKMSLLGSILMR